MSKLSRNDVCWCGSGIKYKKCHMEQDERLEDLALQGIPVPDRTMIKTEEQIQGIAAACQLSKKILDMVGAEIGPGIRTIDINQWVHDYTVMHGAYPAPLNYRGYPCSTCTSINEVVCHGIPDETPLAEGDIVNVDVTTVLNGYYGDMSRMFLIGDVAPEARHLVQVAWECMHIGIEQVKPFNRIGDIGYAIEQHARLHNYSTVQDFGGHGVGLEFHEDPFVQHFGARDSGMVLVPNMVFTIEPMINQGTHRVKTLTDGWTTLTADGKLTAQWEHTVRVSNDGVEILTA